MATNKRRIVEGWIDKGGNQLQVARDHLKSYYRYSEAVQASQECVELSVKAVLSLLGVEYASSHGWDKAQFSTIAEQIHARKLVERLTAKNLSHTIRLPRLLLLANFWNHFYLPAKYGFEAGYLAPPQELFDKQDAELAVQHAEECWRAATQLRYLPEDELVTIMGESLT